MQSPTQRQQKKKKTSFEKLQQKFTGMAITIAHADNPHHYHRMKQQAPLVKNHYLSPNCSSEQHFSDLQTHHFYRNCQPLLQHSPAAAP